MRGGGGQDGMFFPVWAPKWKDMGGGGGQEVVDIGDEVVSEDCTRHNPRRQRYFNPATIARLSNIFLYYSCNIAELFFFFNKLGSFMLTQVTEYGPLLLE